MPFMRKQNLSCQEILQGLAAFWEKIKEKKGEFKIKKRVLHEEIQR